MKTEISISIENTKLFIQEVNSSGAQYEISNDLPSMINEIADCLTSYLEHYMCEKFEGEKAAMYQFVIEKCEAINDNECNIYPILKESFLDLETALQKVLEFAKEHPNGYLVSFSDHLIEYELEGADLGCYVDY